MRLSHISGHELEETLSLKKESLYSKNFNDAKYYLKQFNLNYYVTIMKLSGLYIALVDYPLKF